MNKYGYTNKIRIIVLCLSIFFFISSCSQDPKRISQISIEAVEKMPNIPPQYEMKDWNKLSVDYDQFVFDFNQKGTFLPVIWWDKSRINFDQDVIGLPAYIGDHRQTGKPYHESITVMSALLSASLVDIDKSNQDGINFIKMIKNYYNIDNGEGLVLDSTNNDSGNTFWYELYPHILFYALADLYPKEDGLMEIVENTANRWYVAADIMCKSGEDINFEFNSFDFDTMRPNEDSWAEPDGAAGIAWIQYMAYKKFGDKKFLDAADWGITFLENKEHSPYYEMLLPYGAYLAARMNAEQGKAYNVEKLIKWCFNLDGMSARPGISVTSGKWGDYNVDGLYVCWADGKEYAFLMNTFSMAAPLVPLVRYDQRFARSIGKWILNAANNSRLFYPDALPEDYQSSPELEGNPLKVVAYEGLHSSWAGKKPFATGDARRMGWAGTDFGVYGSSHVGIFGGIISKTTDEKILQIDCLKTDFFKEEAYPTYLYYNPYEIEKTIEVDIGEESKNLYDAVSGKFIAKNVSGLAKITIPADTASLIVVVPNNGKMRRDSGKLYVNDIVVDYRVN